MIPLESLTDAEQQVLKDAQEVIDNVQCIVGNRPETIEDAIRQLAEIRSEIYEDLNQIQHEYLILRGAEWLIETGIVPTDVQWFWNPRQTGVAEEPDLAGKHGDDWLVSAEATTSPVPKGKIDERMAETLRNLSQMPGERFYLVRTSAMRTRAETKIGKAGWNIRAVCLD